VLPALGVAPAGVVRLAPGIVVPEVVSVPGRAGALVAVARPVLTGGGIIAGLAQQRGDGLTDGLGGSPADGAGDGVTQLLAQAGQAEAQPTEVAGQRLPRRAVQMLQVGHEVSLGV
jgi:hypothetical protein